LPCRRPAGLLTAGYFAWPEQDFQKRAEEQAQKRVGENGNGRTRGGANYNYIGHFGGIFVPGDAVIGDNCNLSHDVTFARVNRGEARKRS